MHEPVCYLLPCYQTKSPRCWFATTFIWDNRMRIRLILGAVMASFLHAFRVHPSLNCRLLVGRSVSCNTRRLLSIRIPANEITLDSAVAGERPELVISHLESRKMDASVKDKVMTIKELRTERAQLIVKGDHAKSTRKSLSKQIGLLMKKGMMSEVSVLKEEVERATAESHAADEKLVGIDSQINQILSELPNLLDDSVPEGRDDQDNVVVHTWGEERRKVGDGYLWHDDLAKGVNGLDLDAASRMSGARFSLLVGPVARLERALTQYFLDFLTATRGYTEVAVPYLVSRSALEGTGQLPKFEEDLFQVNHNMGGEESFLIPTAEVPVTNIFREQLLNEADLPIRLVSATPSFRAEAGSHGRDTRGLLRQHQFNKVEMVRITTPETSRDEHLALVEDAEALLRSLELPHRRVLLCAGDTGFSARICYDLEVWLPGQQAYREISSCSNCYDFQARRMNLRYRPASVGGEQPKAQHRKTRFPHTLNGSGLAVGRTLVAVLETYQQPDGSIEVPEVLRGYMGGLERIEKPPAGKTGLHRSIYSAAVAPSTHMN